MADADKLNRDDKIEVLIKLIESEYNLFEIAKIAKSNNAYSLAATMHEARARLLVERYNLLRENGHLIKLLPQKTQGFLEVINAKTEEHNK